MPACNSQMDAEEHTEHGDCNAPTGPKRLKVMVLGRWRAAVPVFAAIAAMATAAPAAGRAAVAPQSGGTATAHATSARLAVTMAPPMPGYTPATAIGIDIFETYYTGRDHRVYETMGAGLALGGRLIGGPGFGARPDRLRSRHRQRAVAGLRAFQRRAIQVEISGWSADVAARCGPERHGGDQRPEPRCGRPRHRWRGLGQAVHLPPVRPCRAALAQPGRPGAGRQRPGGGEGRRHAVRAGHWHRPGGWVKKTTDGSHWSGWRGAAGSRVTWGLPAQYGGSGSCLPAGPTTPPGTTSSPGRPRGSPPLAQSRRQADLRRGRRG